MNDHNLDDLIIDSIEPNHSKTKSFLTIVALLIVFLIVGIILAKIYTDKPNNATLNIEKTPSELVAPELKLQAPIKEVKKKNDTSLSNIIEHEIKAPVVKKIEVPPVTVEKPQIPKVLEKIIEKTVEPIKEPVKITQEFTQKPEEPEIPKPVVKKPEIKAIKEITKPKLETPKVETLKPKVTKPIHIPEVPKIVKKPISKPVSKPKNTPKTGPSHIYYIQVGSFKQVPSSRFLSVISNSGFKHTITKASTKGTKKLLIGPYPSRASVDRALVKVRDLINKSAFVVKK